MRAGRLRHRVEIQWPLEIQSQTSGGFSTAWATVFLDSNTPLEAVPAEVLTGPGKEMVAAGAIQAETTARINLRWFDVDIQAFYKWRILWDGRVFNIRSIETDVTGRQEWRLRCEDGVNDG
ncbi:MAG: phage head closure protein [Gammaproteobacteria bacterium]|nr:phage head closure protein [Gammaproteobacteria bacterium]